MDDETRAKLMEAFNAILTYNYGTAADILEKLLGFDNDQDDA